MPWHFCAWIYRSAANYYLRCIESARVSPQWLSICIIHPSLNTPSTQSYFKCGTILLFVRAFMHAHRRSLLGSLGDDVIEYYRFYAHFHLATYAYSDNYAKCRGKILKSLDCSFKLNWIGSSPLRAKENFLINSFFFCSSVWMEKNF